VNKTAGRGIEALRARLDSSSISLTNSKPHRDILTTLWADDAARQEIDTLPRQNNDNYEGFREWLKAQNKTKATIKETVNYAKKYGHVLDSGDAGPLLTLSHRNKHHAMTALANLA
jgi:hypothetical protein